MGIIKVRHKGSFRKTEKFFNRVLRRDYLNILSKYGDKGVAILENATPRVTGKTAESWNYVIEKKKNVVTLAFTNSNEAENNANVVILLMYGHGLNNGSYVEGNDFVHPAILPLFRELGNEAWEEVTK